ncbi:MULTISPECIES: hypothetical protein [unclassified Streptomyces]|uniref:hypothetical protein n=1 Tax=unclassified Streptomyces TaxID=2593676 RepID=UPI0037F675F6
MVYVVTVDTRIPAGGAEMDALHRTGALALLKEGFDAIEAIEGPDGIEVDLLDSIVAVHPGGAMVKVFVEAPALEFAEESVSAAVAELLDRSELLADWTIERCAVELHPDLARESLEAADGPDAPPDDPAARRAILGQSPQAGAETEPFDAQADAEEAERSMRSMATELRAFGPGMFGCLTEEELQDGDPESTYDEDFSTTASDAELAAGALVYGTSLLVDELFQDAETLSHENSNVAECEGMMWLLDELPGRYALQYNAQFTRRFLVTALAMTTRFTEGTFQQLSCVAEELALKLLLREASVVLDTHGLLSSGVSSALDVFANGVYEDMDFEWLYDDSMDGIDEAPETASLGIAPMDLGSWFTPFNKGRYVHPYASS